MDWLRLLASKPIQERRLVTALSPDANSAFRYANNKISSTKYTWYSYIPKALYEQFRRIANIYFAFHAAISLTPVSPVSPVTTILPLVFVIGIAMIKELVEDIKRAQSDREVNNRKVKVVQRDGSLKKEPWKMLCVGDVVLVEQDTFFPADLIFLSSSNTEGTCFVETMNLDGETNLKQRQCVEATATLDATTMEKLTGALLECELPNPSLYTFVGNVTWGEEFINVGPKQILLRGSSLRNTRHVYGLVVFTGRETKIQLNARNPPSKRSQLEKRLDIIIVFQIALLFSMATVSSVVFAIWLQGRRTQERWYLQIQDTAAANAIASAQFNPRRPALAGFLMFFTSYVLYGYFVPISLYVTIEIVKFLQAMFINLDRKMYYEPSGKGARARTSNLNEDLGMVRTILSDKTGTLTQNAMEFFKMSVAGVSYGTGMTEVERESMLRKGKEATPAPAPAPSDSGSREGSSQGEASIEKGYNLRDPRLEDMAWLNEKRPDVIRRFLEVLAVCQTVVPEGEPTPESISYMAESPDEAAFVVAAKRLGFFFFKRTSDKVFVMQRLKEAPPLECKYELLNTIEFSSQRKRMSVIVRDEEDRLLLFCKGADSVIIPRLKEGVGSEFKAATLDHMREYGEAGLRTLAIAYAELDKPFYDSWQERWVAARNDVTSAAAQAEKLELLAEDIEKDLVLVGASAIEDKLQVGVPSTIEKLALAGIKLWVLTGDKLETAINIGYACRLLRHGMAQHIVRLEEMESTIAEFGRREGVAVDDAPALFVATQVKDSLREVQLSSSSSASATSSHALVIDGRALAVVLGHPTMKGEFLRLALACESVICCRVSPKQKALVATMVRKEAGQICLSIGDGANDVGMIQAANIGVGISGVEGQQAAMASDFSISQFRYLQELLLVHGGWSYKRIARLITFFFYKSFVFGFTIFFYNAFASFSGQTIYWEWLLSLYNVFFAAALPIGVVAVCEQDVSARSRKQFPGLYRQGQSNSFFTWRYIFTWMLNGLFQSVVIFFFVMVAYANDVDRMSGKNIFLFAEGVTMYSCVIWLVNLQLAMIIQYWTWIHHLLVWGTIVIWYIFLVLLDLPLKNFLGPVRRIFTEVDGAAPSYYIIVLLIVTLGLLPYLIVSSIKRNRFPEDHHIVQEIELRERVQKRQRRSCGDVEGSRRARRQWLLNRKGRGIRL